MTNRLLAAVIAVAFVLPPVHASGVEDAGKATPSGVSASAAKALAEFNRGAALLEQYQYAKAAGAFETVVDLAPDWQAARFNLALAYFNMHGIGGGQAQLEKARKILEELLRAAPDHRHARFVLGLYHQYLGENEQALKCFRAVHQADPEDAHVAYKYAETLVSTGCVEEGTRMFEKVLAIDPGFISAVYRLATQYIRTNRREKAMPLFERFKELRAAELAGGSFTVDSHSIYGTLGKYYRALGADDLPLVPASPPRCVRILFSPQTRPLSERTQPWNWAGGAVKLPGIAAGDVDGDGDLDLCLCGGKQGDTSIWLNDGTGQFSRRPPVAPRGVSPCLADLDNDGDLDLWLGRAGPDVLLSNDGKGNFGKGLLVSPRGSDQLTTCARLLDIDSDGDLDLLSFGVKAGSIPAGSGSAPAPGAVHNNNRDGTFSEIAARLGLALRQTPVAAVVYDDFDNDRDLDLVIFPAGEGRPVAWVNDRVWQYRILDSAATGLGVHHVTSATSADPDKDGDRDLLVLSADGVHLYVNGGKFRFQRHRAFADRCGWLGGTGGQFADMDNDGDLDLVIPDAHRRDGSRGPVLLVNDWPADRFLDAAEIDPGNLFAALRTEGDASCVVADFTGNGRCDVLLAPTAQRPFLVENVTPGGHWIAMDFRGTRTGDQKSRSNNSAIGARVEVKAGAIFQQYVIGAPSGPVAAGPLRIHAGLGENTKVEWLRVIWPDAVLQAELELAADRTTTVTELPRKTSSCPLLFAWNGSRFEFVADFGGVGGLGYWVAPGTYAAPDPTEYVRVPQLRPRDGQYVLQVTEPLEEVVYLDEAKLVAVDHPLGTEVYPNEMMAVSASPPPFEVFCFRDRIDPIRAVDHRGVDVTEWVRRIDRRYAGATRLDDRFAGLAERHFVELDFGDRLQQVAPDARLVLFLHGWVEYGYSSTNFAASQAGVRCEAPSIHVWRGGRWVEVFHEVGYPAGLQHDMTLEVTGKILPGDRRIRISSNMELYWDRIFLAVHRDDEPLAVREVAAGSADLHFLGYPREYSPDGHHPNLYDYSNIDTAAAWKLMAGDYTRFGEVGELLEAADDCYVIMGRGEEVTLRFPAEAFGPVPEGRRRTFILKTDSFCKDMDLYTAHPETVEPLPFHGMSGYPYGESEHYPDTERTRQYRRRFDTRRVQGR